MKLRNPVCFHAGVCSICGKKKQKLGSATTTLTTNIGGQFQYIFKDTCMKCMKLLHDSIKNTIEIVKK